jgi:hypothetical protein
MAEREIGLSCTLFSSCFTHEVESFYGEFGASVVLGVKE